MGGRNNHLHYKRWKGQSKDGDGYICRLGVFGVWKLRTLPVRGRQDLSLLQGEERGCSWVAVCGESLGQPPGTRGEQNDLRNTDRLLGTAGGSTAIGDRGFVAALVCQVG